MARSEQTDASDEAADGEYATRVVLSYPEGLSDWSRDQIDTDRYRSYFRRVLGTVEAGETTEEFVDVGCCGSNLDIPFRIEEIEGPGRVGPETEIVYTTHEGEVDGGWKVQSEAGPPYDDGE